MPAANSCSQDASIYRKLSLYYRRISAGFAVLAAATFFAATAPTTASAEAKIRTVAGSCHVHEGDVGKAVGPAAALPMGSQIGLAVDRRDTLFLTDALLQSVSRVSDGQFGLLAKPFRLPKDDDGRIKTLAFNNPQKSNPPREQDWRRVGPWKPMGIALRSNGNLVVADIYNRRIVEVSPYGKVVTLAGTGERGRSPDGTEALKAKLTPIDVAIDWNGDVVFADISNDTVGRIRQGKVYTVAGNGERGYSGDGGNALEAKLHGPHAVAVGEVGEIFVSDTDNDRIRLVKDGKIKTVAGTGEAGFNARDGRADEVHLNRPASLLYLKGGQLLFSDLDNNAIRKISLSENRIETLLGNGTYGFSPDGTDQADVVLSQVTGLGVTSRGELLFGDHNAQCVRGIDLKLPQPPTFVIPKVEVEEDLDALAAELEGRRLPKKKAPAAVKKKKKKMSVSKATAPTADSEPQPTATKDKEEEPAADETEVEEVTEAPEAAPEPEVVGETEPSIQPSKKKKKQKKKAVAKTPALVEIVPERDSDDDADWTTVVHGKRSRPKEERTDSLGERIRELLDAGVVDDEVATSSNTLVGTLLDDFDGNWLDSWGHHIFPRHGSKLRAEQQQEIDGKKRTYFTLGEQRASRLVRWVLNSFTKKSDNIVSRWQSERRDEVLAHRLVLESKELPSVVGRQSQTDGNQTLCYRIRVVLGLNEEGLWIASSYPIL